MTTNKEQLELGYAGLAILRNRLVGSRKVADKIAKEVAAIVDALGEDDIGPAREIKKYDVPGGYKAWSDTYDRIPNLLIEVEEPVVRSLIQEFNKGKALDAACGTGRYSQILHSLGHDVVGVDRTPEMLGQARSRVPKANFILGDLNRLPVQSSSMDLAICALALTHLSSPNKAIKELNRVVRRGGHIILSDIHPWFVIIGGQAEFQDIKGKKGYVFNHIHLPSSYLEIFEDLGLKIRKCLEPALDLKHLDEAKMDLQLSKETIHTALEGLPLVLIWVLEKIKGK